MKSYSRALFIIVFTTIFSLLFQLSNPINLRVQTVLALEDQQDISQRTSNRIISGKDPAVDIENTPDSNSQDKIASDSKSQKNDTLESSIGSINSEQKTLEALGTSFGNDILDSINSELTNIFNEPKELQSVSNTNKEQTENRGRLIAFKHGYNSSGEAFDFIVDHINTNHDNFIDAGMIIIDKSQENLVNFITTKDFNFALNKYNVPSNFQLNEQIDILQEFGLNIMIKVEFSDPFASHFDQIREFSLMANYISTPDTKLTLIGHSRGGLVGLGFTGKKHNYKRVEQIITVNTPYEPNTIANIGTLIFNQPALLDLAGQTPALETIRESWNYLAINGKSPHVDAIYSTMPLIDNDGLISSEAQSGGKGKFAFKEITPRKKDSNKNHLNVITSKQTSNLMMQLLEF